MVRYGHATLKGRRLPGWDELNVRKLAEDLRVCPQHLRQALTGRTNCNITLLRRVAAKLSLSLSELAGRIEQARRLDQQRVARQ